MFPVVDIQVILFWIIILLHPWLPMLQRNLVQQFYSEHRSSKFLYHTSVIATQNINNFKLFNYSAK